MDHGRRSDATPAAADRTAAAAVLAHLSHFDWTAVQGYSCGAPPWPGCTTQPDVDGGKRLAQSSGAIGNQHRQYQGTHTRILSFLRENKQPFETVVATNKIPVIPTASIVYNGARDS